MITQLINFNESPFVTETNYKLLSSKCALFHILIRHPDTDCTAFNMVKIWLILNIYCINVAESLDGWMAPCKQHRSFIFLCTQLGLYNWVVHLILKSTTKAHHRPQSTRAMSLSPQNTGHNIIIISYTILKWTTNSDYIPWPETR